MLQLCVELGNISGVYKLSIGLVHVLLLLGRDKWAPRVQCVMRPPKATLATGDYSGRIVASVDRA